MFDTERSRVVKNRKYLLWFSLLLPVRRDTKHSIINYIIGRLIIIMFRNRKKAFDYGN